MEEQEEREKFNTGLSKIRSEIKGRLVAHGFFGSITHAHLETVEQVPTGSTIEIAVKGRTVGRSFSRQDIEACHLRVGGAVLKGIIAMVHELSTSVDTTGHVD
jgi:hypothetical protein